MIHSNFYVAPGPTLRFCEIFAEYVRTPKLEKIKRSNRKYCQKDPRLAWPEIPSLLLLTILHSCFKTFLEEHSNFYAPVFWRDISSRCVYCTLVYRIDVQTEINVQVEKFLKNIKRAGGKIFSKSINVQTKIRLCRGEFWGGNFLPLELWDTLGCFGILWDTLGYFGIL